MNLAVRSRLSAMATVAAALLLLVPVASSALTDPVFLGCVFDAGDWDDVVELALSMVGCLQDAPASGRVLSPGAQRLWLGQPIVGVALLARLPWARAPTRLASPRRSSLSRKHASRGSPGHLWARTSAA